MSVLKTLRAKLFYLLLVSVSISALPCYYVADGFSSRLKECRRQREAVALLDSVA